MSGKTLEERVGERIRAKRLERGLTQCDLEIAAMIPMHAMGRFELGKRSIRLYEIVAIAKALGTTVGYLIGEVEK